MALGAGAVARASRLRPTGRFGTFEKEAGARRKSLTATCVEDENQIPVYDLGRIKELTQEALAPALGRSRRALSEQLSGRTPDTKEAVRGFGESIAAQQAGAVQTATGLYRPEYQRELLEFQREEREAEKEEAAQFRRGRRDPSSTTYAEAQARLGAWDPYGAKGQTTTAVPRRVTPTTVDYGRKFATGTGL